MMNHDHRTLPRRRMMVMCCAAALGGWLAGQADEAAAGRPAAAAPPALPPEAAALLERTWRGLDPAVLWDAHAHLLGTGDAGSGCRVHPHLQQWWHPVESLRRRVIMGAAGVPADAPSVDRAFVARLQALARDFPPGARWLLYAFDNAHDERGHARRDWSTFHVPNAYAAQVAAADFPLIVQGGEEKAVPGAEREAFGNPLLVRAALACGVRVIVAHCDSLGEAADLDATSESRRPAFDLFARLMDEPAWRGRLLGDVSALFQANRRVAVWRRVLRRDDWHPRLLHGSDYPLPGVGPLYQLGKLVRAGLLAEADVPALDALRARNPLLFDLALKRRVSDGGAQLAASVFDTRAQLARRTVSTVSPNATV